ELHDVGRFATDDLDERMGAGHALVRHQRGRDAPTDRRQAGDVVARDRLLDEREPVGLEATDERRRLGERQALVEVDTQREAIADGRSDGRHALDALATGARDLDLRRAKPARRPVRRLARRLDGRHGADPGVERDLVAHDAAEQRVHGHPERAALQIENRHLDGGFGLGVAVALLVHPRGRGGGAARRATFGVPPGESCGCGGGGPPSPPPPRPWGVASPTPLRRAGVTRSPPRTGWGGGPPPGTPWRRLIFPATKCYK